MMRILDDIRRDVHRIRNLLEDENGEEERRCPKMTPEEHAEREKTQRMIQERIAYHEAKAREQEEAQRRHSDTA
jgi:hypothetical protein